MTERRLIDVDITDRADGRIPAWDDDDNTHKYIEPAGISTQAVRVTRNADYSSISSGGTAIPWDNEVRDDGGFFDSGSATRLTAPADGWYCIQYAANSGATSSDSFYARLRVDGSTVIHSNRNYETTNDVTYQLSGGTTVYLSANSYVELLLDVGATQTVRGETLLPGHMNMSMFKVV